MTNPFHGLGVALITPFCEDGSVDHTALAQHVEHLISHGVDFLCALGTTAEPPTLTAEEKAAILHTVIETNQRRVPILVGAGSNDTRQTCDYIQSLPFEEIQGVLIVTPYYNKPSQEGLYQHYKAIDSITPVPVILYNVPGRTGVNMLPETVVRIARDCPNIVAIKEATGKVEQAAAILSQAPAGFSVFSGDDSKTLEIIQLGGAGVISVVGNAYPEEFGKVVHRQDAAADEKLKNIVKLTMADGNPAGIKCILNTLGRCRNTLRLPLVSVCNEVEQAIKEEVSSLALQY